VVDGRDNDCDGLVDDETDIWDDDGDGYSEADGDCDDGDAHVYPGAPEGLGDPDLDCDGEVFVPNGWGAGSCATGGRRGGALAVLLALLGLRRRR
jgi:hypothetical protein